MTMPKGRCIRCTSAIDVNSNYCSLCGAKQPLQGNASKKKSITSIIIPLFVVGVFALLYLNGGESLGKFLRNVIASPTPYIAKVTAPPATTRPSLPMPRNGEVTKYTFAEHEAPFEVVVPDGGEYYYVILTESTNTKLKVISVIIHPGEAAEIDVPLGSYKMFYATGGKWYGKSDLFGEEMRMYQAEDVLEFYVSGNRVMGHSIELIKQVGGNLETVSVNPDDFPL